MAEPPFLFPSLSYEAHHQVHAYITPFDTLPYSSMFRNHLFSPNQLCDDATHTERDDVTHTKYD